MNKNSVVSMFIAASALTVAPINEMPCLAESSGGLKEWTTDQDINDKSVLDADAMELMKKAEEEDVCVPIGEGENCW